MGKVVLLTGAPGVGKSTLRNGLMERVPNLRSIDYGKLLIDHKSVMGVNLDYAELREQSSAVIAPSDVNTVDESVIRNVQQLRQDSHVILDSHAFTAETYGLRAVPYSMSQLQRLDLDMVIVLHCDPEVLAIRIQNQPDGRRDIGMDLLRQLQTLQEAVGLIYSIVCGCPVHIIDVTSKSKAEVREAAEVILAAIDVRASDYKESI